MPSCASSAFSGTCPDVSGCDGRPMGTLLRTRVRSRSREGQYRTDGSVAPGRVVRVIETEVYPMEDSYSLFVGVDWATEVDQVCILDEKGKRLEERRVAHTGAAIAEFVGWLLKRAGGTPDRVGVAIEIPRGALVDALVERNVHVYSINPKQLDRFRDRHTVAGAKDDRRDALVLADSLRTDRRAFYRVRVEDPLILELRELSRADDDLMVDLGRVTNRLRDQVHRYYEQVLDLSPAANEPWIWALLELARTPQAARRLKLKRVEALLCKHRIRRVTAQQVLDQLNTPPLPVASGVTEAAVQHIRILIPQLRLIHQQRKDCARAMKAMMARLPYDEDEAGKKEEHRDVDILRSLPGTGDVVAATVLAEASLPLKDRAYHTFRALCGLAPVTKQSGKQGQRGQGRRRPVLVSMRRACNQRLRRAMHYWSNAVVMNQPEYRARYAELRRRGCTHGRALRTIGDKLARILFAMLRDRTLYRPDFKRTTEAQTLNEHTEANTHGLAA